jgi:glycosyltransferase involved in cell wall biosynthesis
MRILQIATHYYPRIGGLEYVVKSVSERLARMGHNVTVIAGEPEIEEPREEEVNGVRVIRWPTWSPGEAYHIPRRRGKLEALLEELSRDVDVIHVHSVHSVFSMLSLRLVKRKASKTIVTPYYHGTGHTIFRRLLWSYWRPYVRRLLKDSIVHTVSKLEANLVERNFSCKTVTIENGVEEWLRSVKWDPEGYVMYSGRLEKYKNIHVLAQLVNILNKQYDLNLKFKVFGRGPYRASLEKFLKTIGVEYELSDFKPYKEYIDTLSRANLLGLLSEREAYPQSVNEANAIGVPVVIAKPWGFNFEGRSRTLIVDPRLPVHVIASRVYDLLAKAPLEGVSRVPTWDEVVETYIAKLYEA